MKACCRQELTKGIERTKNYYDLEIKRLLAIVEWQARLLRKAGNDARREDVSQTASTE